MSQRIRVGVVYGGRSSEHSISAVSAGSILAALDPAKYDVVTLGITRTGRWVRVDVGAEQLRIVGRELPEVRPADGVELAVRRPGGEVAVFDAGSAISALDDVDVVFPVLHGAYGEDGTIQGLFEMAAVPYVGSGVLASAACMDKVFTKVVLRSAGLTVGDYVAVRRSEVVSAADVEHLGLPVFVKPARAGSSVGISKVRSYEQLPAALNAAFEHDSKVLIEAAIAGREIECGVLQDADGAIMASAPAEIRLRPGIDFYDFDAKYLDDACEFDVPADLPSETVKSVQDAACRAFAALDCEGLARVDFFLRADSTIVVNEVNTMPGFTPVSMYPRMWSESGVGYAELVDRLLATALARR